METDTTLYKNNEISWQLGEEIDVAQQKLKPYQTHKDTQRSESDYSEKEEEKIPSSIENIGQ